MGNFMDNLHFACILLDGSIVSNLNHQLAKYLTRVFSNPYTRMLIYFIFRYSSFDIQYSAALLSLL